MPRPVIFLFVLIPVYWAYLLFNTRPILIYDAIGYDELGRLVMDNGLSAYFDGLRREPLFPYLISRAMILAKTFGSAYHYYLKVILFISLGITLVGIYRLTRLLGAGRIIAGLGTFYAGISPALVNSTLWLWSEAASYPLVVWGMFFLIKSWRSAMSIRGSARTVCCAATSAVLFILLLFVKASVSIVVILLGIPFVLAGGIALFRRESGRAAAFFMASVIIFGSFYAAIEGYKFLNLRGNGHYTLTDRFDWALYGNTVRRVQPLTRERISQFILSVPRLGLCEKYYGSACVFWSSPVSDKIGLDAATYYSARGLSPDETQKALLAGSFTLMKQHPFQQAVMFTLEATKMLFWENRVWFVRYPDWMVKLYSNNGLVFTLCFGWAFLSLAALCFALTRRSAEFLLTAIFVLGFIGVYAFFFIDIRHDLPVAPLFIALAAGMIGHIFRCRRGCFSTNTEV